MDWGQNGRCSLRRATEGGANAEIDEDNEKPVTVEMATADQLKTRHVGKQDPKRHLEEAVEKAMGDQVVQNLGTMLLAEL